MTDANLSEFLTERVMATRETHHIQYPLDMDVPATAVILECSEDALTIVILPVFVRDIAYLEIHTFVDGVRQEPDFAAPDGCIELVLHRPLPTD